jgi:hypothetical protein
MLAGASVAAAHATSAWAQAADEYNMLVIDQTGSMNESGIDTGDGTPHGTVFDNAVSAAQNWVFTDRATRSTVRRAYAIFTFKDDNCCNGSQTGLIQIWPKSTSPDCQSATSGSTFEASTSYCLFNATSAVPYDSLSTTLDTIRVQQMAAGGGTIGGDPNGILSPITLAAGQPPGGASFDPAFGLGPNTPLASSLCDSVERLQLLAPTKNKAITLETDGGENFSAGACSGAAATSFPTSNAFPMATPDWAYAPDTSWQVHDLRRLTRLISFPPVSGGLAANEVQANAAIAAGPIKSPPAGTDAVPANMKWRIDVHFAICDPNFPAVLPCTTTTAAAAMDKRVFAAGGKGVKGSLEGVGPARVTIDARTVAQSTPPPPARHPSISTDELNFFTQLGHVTSKSSFRSFVRDPAVKFGTTHKLAGDVDDSGCVDRADFSIVTQSDVYFQRAVQPLQIAIRADLNADGWVNRQDAQIVLNNWGHGCINPVGAKPPIP